MAKTKRVPPKDIEELTIKMHRTLAPAYDEDGDEIEVPGIYYEIHADGVEVDGGMCTGTLEDALNMAYDQAQTVAMCGYAIKK